jgi:hypothetical protein
VIFPQLGDGLVYETVDGSNSFPYVALVYTILYITNFIACKNEDLTPKLHNV